MKRRSFLKRIGIAIAAAPLISTVAIEDKPKVVPKTDSEWVEVYHGGKKYFYYKKELDAYAAHRSNLEWKFLNGLM